MLKQEFHYTGTTVELHVFKELYVKGARVVGKVGSDLQVLATTQRWTPVDNEVSLLQRYFENVTYVCNVNSLFAASCFSLSRKAISVWAKNLKTTG